jgi:hypothetical protein
MIKSILTAILITASLLLANAQKGTPTLYGTATLFQLGEVNQVTEEIDWIGIPSQVEILVQVNYGELIIYSEEHQVYQITQRMGHHKDTTMYKAKDKKGNTCWLFITTIQEGDKDQIVITIRYTDYAWLYLCTEN